MYNNIILIVIIIFIAGLFSSIESAIMSLNSNKIKIMAETGDKKAIILKKHLQNNKKNLTVTQIGITFFGLLAGALAERFFVYRLIMFVCEKYNIKSSIYVYATAVIIITLILTYFVFVFGKFIPRMFGSKNSEGFAFRTIKILRFFEIISAPFLFLSTLTADFFVKIFGFGNGDGADNITEEEIRFMVDASGGNGSIDEAEMEMINNIFDFNNTSASDICTHRTDIVAVSSNADLTEILTIVNNEKYSRIPVYNESIDDIVGIFHIKDMAKYILNDIDKNKYENFDINKILMTPYFIPFSKKTDELFREMQKNKVHMAIVIDEYGGTAGIVTMEDLIEEIVGNIFDEYDEDEDDDIRIIDDIFLIKGTASIDDVEEILGISFIGDDYDTIGGFLIGQLGRIPDENENLTVVVNDFTFEIEKIEEKRIELIRVTNNNKSQQDLD